jgi:SrtB family sortase
MFAKGQGKIHKILFKNRVLLIQMDEGQLIGITEDKELDLLLNKVVQEALIGLKLHPDKVTIDDEELYGILNKEGMVYLKFADRREPIEVAEELEGTCESILFHPIVVTKTHKFKGFSKRKAADRRVARLSFIIAGGSMAAALLVWFGYSHLKTISSVEYWKTQALASVEPSEAGEDWEQALGLYGTSRKNNNHYIDPKDAAFNLQDSLLSLTSLAEAREVNEQALGWLTIPKTNISYPLMQNREPCRVHGVVDNCYYLRRGVGRQPALSGDPSGAIFVDAGNNIDSYEKLSSNTVIYGHNWTNTEENGELKVLEDGDLQFAQLPSLADESVFNSIPMMDFQTADGKIHKAQIFAVYYCRANVFGAPYYYDTCDERGDLAAVLEIAKSNTLYQTRVSVGENDKIITLSTCTMKEYSDGSGRFVVQAKIVH